MTGHSHVRFLQGGEKMWNLDVISSTNEVLRESHESSTI